MAKRLSDSEFAERTRAANRRRTERHHQRLIMAGRTALTVWIPAAVRTALTTKAANDGATIADTAAALLTSALDTATIPTSRPASPSPVDSLPLFDTALDTSPPLTATERDQQILELHRQGVSGREIARQVGCSEPTVRRALKNQEATG